MCDERGLHRRLPNDAEAFRGRYLQRALRLGGCDVHRAHQRCRKGGVEKTHPEEHDEAVAERMGFPLLTGAPPLWRRPTVAFSDARCLSFLAGSPRLGTSSPLGGPARDGPEEKDVSRSVARFGRAADFEDVSTRYGVVLDSHGLRTRRTSMRASSPKATEVEECVGAIRRLPLVWRNPSRWRCPHAWVFAVQSREQLDTVTVS